MTSSLVGSEMCIRDRCGGRLCHSEDGGPRPLRSPLPPWSLHGRGRESGPVSYTHLTLPTICSV
eukprot:1635894-Prorocentrum_lima.AAC.1